MLYATPAAFIARYGADECAQILADNAGLLTPYLLTAAANGAFDSTTTSAQQFAATTTLTKLVRQLAASSNYMDGYLRSVVTLPLSASDANSGALEVCCIELTRGAIASDGAGATERTDMLADRHRTWLKDISAGRVQLVNSSGASISGAAVRSGQAGSRFAWNRFPRGADNGYGFGGGY